MRAASSLIIGSDGAIRLQKNKNKSFIDIKQQAWQLAAETNSCITEKYKEMEKTMMRHQ